MKYWFIFLIILITSCSTIKPPAPALPPSTLSSSPLSDSKIDVPITLDLAAMLNDINTKIPPVFSGEGQAGPGQYRWSIQRTPFHVEFRNDSLIFIDSAQCTGGGYIKNPLNKQWIKVSSCDVNITMGIGTAFNAKNNYALATGIQLTQFDVSDCNLAFKNINIAPLLKPQAIAAINGMLPDINQSIGRYNIKNILQPFWPKLNQPIKLGDMGYLSIHPSQIGVEKITRDQNTLNLNIGITAKPVFSVDKPANQFDAPFPDLSYISGNGFNLNIDARLAYKPINNLLKNIIENKEIPLGDNSSITIKEAEIYGAGNDHLLIKVRFVAKKGIIGYHGLLYLTCMPNYDLNSGNFYISDIDFDKGTTATLTGKATAWLLNSAIRRYLNSQVHFDLSGPINAVKTQLNQSINRDIDPHIHLSGNVSNLTLQSILPASDYLLVRVSTTGNLSVNIH